MSDNLYWRALYFTWKCLISVEKSNFWNSRTCGDFFRNNSQQSWIFMISGCDFSFQFAIFFKVYQSISISRHKILFLSNIAEEKWITCSTSVRVKDITKLNFLGFWCYSSEKMNMVKVSKRIFPFGRMIIQKVSENLSFRCNSASRKLGKFMFFKYL